MADKWAYQKMQKSLLDGITPYIAVLIREGTDEGICK